MDVTTVFHLRCIYSNSNTVKFLVRDLPNNMESLEMIVSKNCNKTFTGVKTYCEHYTFKSIWKVIEHWEGDRFGLHTTTLLRIFREAETWKLLTALYLTSIILFPMTFHNRSILCHLNLWNIRDEKRILSEHTISIIFGDN